MADDRINRTLLSGGPLGSTGQVCVQTGAYRAFTSAAKPTTNPDKARVVFGQMSEWLNRPLDLTDNAHGRATMTALYVLN